MDRTIINSFKEIEIKVYGYTLPEVPNHKGYVKIGDTSRDTISRIFEQVGTAGLNPDILFERLARKSDGQWFRDKELHKFLMLNGIEKKDFNGKADEWFDFKDNLSKAEELTDKFISKDYDEVQISDEHTDYVLRREQFEAVQRTYDYYSSSQEPKEFLWNAKPRFGKTLTTYDFIRKISAQNILIVTNRPAIANSWFDDFQKFISWQEPYMKFVSETDALKDKAMSRAQFVEYVEGNIERKISQIAFLSLQDLKGAKFAGGNYDKLEWVRDLKWDLLVVDEAHEGVDTEKTDTAFDNIQREFTLHLSGTPFKAIANNKFSAKQIFNWSYTDEQDAKKNWDESLGSNPYENLPTLNLFTYQMSKMIEDELSRGITLDDEKNVDYAFDLNEFFKVKDNGTFEYEESVLRFLDNLSSGKFPFATDEYRDELKHTFWLLPRVNSAKAMEKILRNHPVFKSYKVVLAAGDGAILHDDMEEEALDFKENEKSFNKVKKAIQENDRTITLSVGQLTTGVTIPEWTAVLMLNNIKSPSLYFQAAFRAQNPHQYVQEDRLYRKENAYIFDFSPERTLVLYDEFANNLSGNGDPGFEERKKKIRELLNFFPVIAEDEQGQMQEIDVEEVLSIPTRITSTEVVKRGFMSNLLFANISGIFSGDSPFKEILDKIKPEKNKKMADRRDINVTKPMLNDNGEVEIPSEIIINEAKDLFGEKIYKVVAESLNISNSTLSRPENLSIVAEKITDSLGYGLTKLTEKFDIKKTHAQNIKDEIRSSVNEVVEESITIYEKELNVIKDSFSHDYEEAKKENNPIILREIKDKYDVKKAETEVAVKEKIAGEVKAIVESVVEEQIEKVEEKKKKTTEDDVRDHLRGFARTIPAFLMAYGNDTTKLANFEVNINEETFLDLTSISIDEFKKLRDGFVYTLENGTTKKVPGLFNEVVFNSSVQEFFRTKKRLANYFDESLNEDIFDYIPPQKTNQIFTPRSVVKMMVDELEKENPGIFSNKNLKFADLYVKSGLYVTEIVKRLNKGLAKEIPNQNDRLNWILKNQVYSFAPNEIIYRISREYIYGETYKSSGDNLIKYDVMNAIFRDSPEDIIKENFGDDSLKFDIIIGNPPYQEEAKGTSTSDDPVYHLFMDQSYLLAKKVMLITPARFLFNAGKTPSSWNQKMLHDKHLKVVYYETDSTKVFPNTSIPGGVAVTYRDMEKEYTEIGTYVSFPELNQILKKVSSISTSSLKDIAFSQNKFDLTSLYRDFPDYEKKIGSEGRDKRFRQIIMERLDVFTDEKKNKDDIRVLGLINKKRAYRFIPKKYVEETEWLYKYKVFVPFSNGASGTLGESAARIISTPVIGRPGEGITQTFIGFGALDTEEEAENLLNYIRSKFARVMLGILKVTQGNKPETWKYVPLQDFTSNSDINWSRDIQEIDKQLYNKYNLSQEQISFIEKKIDYI